MKRNILLILGIIILVGAIIFLINWFNTPKYAGAWYNGGDIDVCSEGLTYEGPNPCSTPKPTPTPKPFHFACREGECVKVQGKGENSCLPQVWEEECQPKVTPTPKPTGTPVATAKPTSTPPPSTTNGTPQGPFDAPVCGNSPTTLLAINPHVWRKGSDAKIDWQPTEGNNVNIYFKQVKSPIWQYSLSNQPNNGHADIHGLGSLDITFAVQQTWGCGGGPITNANTIIDSATTGWVWFGVTIH